MTKIPAGDMSDSAQEITNLIYSYAELLDAGDLDGVAGLFAHGRICGVENGPPETVFDGTARVRQMYEMATRIHEDGTPKTKHNTSNVQLEINDRAVAIGPQFFAGDVARFEAGADGVLRRESRAEPTHAVPPRDVLRKDRSACRTGFDKPYRKSPRRLDRRDAAARQHQE